MLQRQYFFGSWGEEDYRNGYLSEIREYSLYVCILSNSECMTPKQISQKVALDLMSIAEEDLYYADLLYNQGRIIKKYALKKPE